MATKPRWMRDLDQDQVDFYLSLSAEVTVCRGKRRHDFPGIVPGKPVPDSIVITRYHGAYQVTEYCERGCGRWITYSAGRDGQPDYSTVRYGGWKSGKELATGLGLTAGNDKQFMSYKQRESVVEGFELQQRQRERAAEEEARQRAAAEAALAGEPDAGGVKFQSAEAGA